MADNPILKALPPETDYLTYLTLLEYNLTVEQLPTLHDILQDTTLTANIGWDLVHLLLPFLPASQQCLQDVARLGNPREVVLKVTELLEEIGVKKEDEEEDQGDDKEEGHESVSLGKLTIAEDGRGVVADNESTASDATTDKPMLSMPKAEEKRRSKPVQFIALLEMLSILHPRIKTKYPSRFLSTSLQAILPAYTQLAAAQEVTEAILGFIKALCGAGRPRLPPRKNSNAVILQEKSGTESAPDPEGKDETLAPDEVALQNRLLQSFLTHVIEDYVFAVSMIGDISGLAWSSRLHEKLHPQKTRPDRKLCSAMFAEEDTLHGRDAIIGQIVALARDLKLYPSHLLEVVSDPEPEPSSTTADLPSTASDVPLSHTGSLYLLCATAAATGLFNAPSSLPSLQIYPDYMSMVTTFIADPGTGGIGSEPEALIDSILFLGSFILNAHEPTLPPNDDIFTGLLQRLSLLSANCPSPTLRYHAHVLTSELLHSNPSDHVRLAFIKDTLEHCPYENLKASAVGWLKDEVLAADDYGGDGSPPIFATPTALTTVAPFLFPDLGSRDDNDYPEEAKLREFRAHQSFHLAVLNFYYLLLSSPPLFSNLEIAQLTEDYNIRYGCISRLSQMSEDLRRHFDEDDEEAMAECGLFDMTIHRVLEAMCKASVTGMGMEG